MTPPFVRAGRRGGAPVLHFHGAPGAPSEDAIFASAADALGIELWSLDRARLAPDATGRAYLGALSAAVAEFDAGRRIPILGFSIGAALAIRVAARLGAAAGPLKLVSAAAPPDFACAGELGAGGRVFRLARANGPAFAAATRAQAALSRLAPSALRRLLLARADPADAAFATSATGRALLSRVFADAWADGGGGYRRDLLAYVETWSADLAGVRAPVALWHGARDAWAPLAATRAMAARLPGARLRTCDAGHYTTLARCAAEALACAA